jgi:ribosomal protein L1
MMLCRVKQERKTHAEVGRQQFAKSHIYCNIFAVFLKQTA